MPVVICPGRLAACPHGFGLITGWFWDCKRMTTWITVDTLWERYSAIYPVERVDRVDGCPKCVGPAA